MTDKKFTDEEIIETLERCSKGDGCYGCAKAYMRSAKCIRILEAECLGLINRQKTEIERLKECPKCVYEYDGKITEYCVQGPCSNFKTVEQVKAEACKNFSQKLIKSSRLIAYANGFDIKVVVDVEEIVKILKETVGEEP